MSLARNTHAPGQRTLKNCFSEINSNKLLNEQTAFMVESNIIHYDILLLVPKSSTVIILAIK